MQCRAMLIGSVTFAPTMSFRFAPTLCQLFTFYQLLLEVLSTKFAMQRPFVSNPNHQDFHFLCNIEWSNPQYNLLGTFLKRPCRDH